MNTETKIFYTHYTNDEFFLKYMNGMALKFWTQAEPDASWSRADKAILAVGAWLELNCRETFPLGIRIGSVWHSLLENAISHVKWHEIAANFLEKYREVDYAA